MNGPPPQPDPRRLLPLIVAIAGMGVLTFTLISPALPDLADELGVSHSTIGWIQGVVAMPGIFLALFIGYVYDKTGRRTVAIVSLLIFGVAGMAGFFARSFWPLVAVRAIQGIGTSGILSSGVIVIGDLFPPGSQRRWALGINSAGLTVTGMIAPIIGGSLAEADPFLPFLVFGLALPLAWWARKLPGKPVGPPPNRPLRHLQETYGVLRERKKLADFVGLLPFAMFSLVVFVGLGATTTPLFLESEFGVSAAGRGAIQAFLSVGSTIGSLNTARITDRIGPGRVFSAGFGLIGLGFAGMALAPGLPFVALGLATVGLGAGFAFPLLQDFVASAVPGTYRGAAVGAFVMAVRVGQAAGPIAGSALAESPGSRTAYAMAGAATALILLAWRPIRRAAKQVEGRAADRRGPGSV